MTDTKHPPWLFFTCSKTNKIVSGNFFVDNYFGSFYLMQNYVYLSLASAPLS